MTPIRRRVAATAIVLLVPVLAACGFNAQTDQVYQAATGVNDRSGTINVLNALIVSGEDGSGTFAGSLVNLSQKDDDTLVSITGDGITATGTPVTVPADQLVNLATKGQVTMTGDGVVPGKWVRLELKFQSGQTTDVNVPVVTHMDEYSQVPMPTSAPSSSS
jgi:hypothetical protein